MGTGRTFFIDRLRVVLTALVILHHTAITYGGSGDWFYREVRDGGSPTSFMLTVFCAVNQSFFMGMFFLLAGYFTPGSVARKGIWHYMQERLVRLGIPLLIFGFLLGPLTVALAGAAQGNMIGERWLALLSKATFIIGPLWFAWALLLFACGFVLWRSVQSESVPDVSRAVPKSSWWWLSALGVGAVALALRQIVPVGENVLGLQLGYFSSYIFLFALGCAASRYRWLERLERKQAIQWIGITVGMVPTLFIVAALAGALEGKPVNFNEGLDLPAIIYAFWEPLVAWGIIASLLVVFRERFNTPSELWKRWGAQAYGAFIVHAPIVVALSVALSSATIPPAVKFIIVGAASIVASFVVAAALLRLPGARRVI